MPTITIFRLTAGGAWALLTCGSLLALASCLLLGWSYGADESFPDSWQMDAIERLPPVDEFTAAATTSVLPHLPIPDAAEDEEIQRLPPPDDQRLSPQAVSAARARRTLFGMPPLPAGDEPRGWWDERVVQPMREQAKPWNVDLDTLLLIALRHSEHVQALSLEPQIRETEVARQAAQFDTSAFLESKWNDLNDPVGNTLTTGGPNRYLDENWENRGGLRRKNWLGGEAEIAQEFGLRETNSLFFIPAQQANTRLVLSYTQPLMKGRGRCYNESLVVLAHIDSEVARRELERQLQEHFFQVAEAYWRVWLERARFVQQREASGMTQALLEELEGRRDMDVLESHILRARGALAVRQAALQRAGFSVRNQETRLWALTGAPELRHKHEAELVPQAIPAFDLPPIDRAASVQEAIQRRPEVTATLEKIQASQTRLQVATHELMPALNLALQAYAHGLNGNFDAGQAFGNQFTQGDPGYTAGLLFEMPLGNAAAHARLRRREMEARQLTLEFEATLKEVTADVENAIRDTQAARSDAAGQHQAMLAARAELDYILSRWRMLPGDERTTSLMLDEALDALDRLVSVEGAMAQAQVDYALSLIHLKRAMGQLFQADDVKGTAPAEVLVTRRPMRSGAPESHGIRR